MKSFTSNRSNQWFIAITALFLVIIPSAKAQIYVTTNGGAINEYDANTGSTIVSSLVTALGSNAGVAVDGGSLYVSTPSSGASDGGILSSYDATTGALINSNLFPGTWTYTSTGGNGTVSGQKYPYQLQGGIAVTGGNIYVTDNMSAAYTGMMPAMVSIVNTTGSSQARMSTMVSGTFAQIALSGSLRYFVTTTSGDGIREVQLPTLTSQMVSPVTDATLSWLTNTVDIAASAQDLFIATNSSISSYNFLTKTFEQVNGSNFSITGFTGSITGIALSGSNLYVATSDGKIGEYDATTGATISASLVTGVTGIKDITVVQTVPEPTSLVYIIGGLGILGLRFRRRTC